MTAPRDVVSVVRQWVEKAEDDLRVIEHLLPLKDECPYSAVCFHAQQCTEKYLKALLVLYSVPFPKVHDLLELLPLVPKTVALGLKPTDVATVNRYVVEGRYPGEWEPITREDTAAAVAVARKVRDAVRQHLPDVALRA